MSYFDILAKFLEMYPQFHEQIHFWRPNGFQSITVWMHNGQVFDFTYFRDNYWNLVRNKMIEMECRWGIKK